MMSSVFSIYLIASRPGFCCRSSSWSVVFFNPFDPAAIDTEYKTGDDMLYAQYLLDSGDDVQAVWVGRRDQDDDVDADVSSLAFKYHRFSEASEFDLLVAEHYDESIVALGGSIVKIRQPSGRRLFSRRGSPGPLDADQLPLHVSGGSQPRAPQPGAGKPHRGAAIGSDPLAAGAHRQEQKPAGGAEPAMSDCTTDF